MENLLEQKERLFKHISETNNVEKLEVTISMVLFGMVMDEENKEEYREILDKSQDRLKVLSIIQGIDHPLLNMDVDRDWKKIEMSVMMSMMKSMIDHEKEDVFDMFGKMSMN
jgi:hypothetical protein